ncbi:MAG: LysR family transcriptional regulator [Geopsychrobacter sp.]|nr:LysR family transcriptional regulator [Geopsychrobacter sp.]
MNSIRVRAKVWLEADGEPLIGDGRERLLRAIDQGGSLNAAAAALGISYRKAWSQLRQMEEHCPFPLVERSKGGKGGGSTQLTPKAHELIDRFARLKSGLNEMIDAKFADQEQK